MDCSIFVVVDEAGLAIDVKKSCYVSWVGYVKVKASRLE